MLKKFLLCSVCCLLVLCSNGMQVLAMQKVENEADIVESALDETENYQYTVLDDGTLEIVEYTGTDIEIIVPEQINGMTVTSIGDKAFMQLRQVISIELPDSITKIGDFAFSECSSLIEINIPEEVVSIGELVFQNCFELKNVYIPKNVEYIGKGAFVRCYKLAISIDVENPTFMVLDDIVYTKDKQELICCVNRNEVVEVADEVRSIAEHAFEGLNVVEVVLPDGITDIKQYTFNDCENLQTVNLPEGLETIEHSAFSGCNKLDGIELPESLEFIGYDAFSYAGIAEVYIPKNVECIEQDAFIGCKNLNIILVSDENGYYFAEDNILYTKDKTKLLVCGKNNENVIVDKNTKEISSGAFSDNKVLYKVELPQGLEIIADNSFKRCDLLKEIVIPDTVARIGRGAFDGCYSLEKVTMLSLSCYFGNEFIHSYDEEWIFPSSTILYGYYGSTMQDYANEYYRTFVDLNGNIFYDVPSDAWYYSYVRKAYDAELMTGKTTMEDGLVKFDPLANMNRAEFVQVLYSMEGKPVVSYTDKFTDIQKGEWYTNAVLWAAENGITSGNPDGSFGKYNNITREQLALMLMKYATLKGYEVSADTDLSNYADDEKVSSWAVPAMMWAVTNGIITGTADGKLNSQGATTRAEGATMLSAFYNMYVQ